MGKGAGKGGYNDEKKQNKMRSDFFFSNAPEPHKIRHKEIIAKHPEIATLYGPDPRPIPIVIALVISQLAVAYFQKDWDNFTFFLVAWIYGGAASHALSLMTHELSHNLLFVSPKANELFGIFCNISMGVPSSTMFKRYHLEHHSFQGDILRDTDIPTSWEGRFFTNTFLKAIWLLCQPLFYALRPTFVRPKNLHPMDLFNTVFIVFTDFLIVHFLGGRALLYIILSTLLGMGFHPVAGHFIAEHYVFDKEVETYSYYGPLNLICWNVGYHNEHHDFPKVPGWRLPQVKAMAPEFYDHLPQHKSWTYVLWRYVTDPTIGPFNRVRRGSGKVE